MFAGHVGVAVALGRVERRLNLGAIVLAALLLDVVLWLLVLAGVEHATIPADYAQRHYLLFDFPYSHGLVAAFAWSLLTALATWYWLRRQRSWRARAALVAGLAVLSHFLLDALVHVPELPVLGDDLRQARLVALDPDAARARPRDGDRPGRLRAVRRGCAVAARQTLGAGMRRRPGDGPDGRGSDHCTGTSRHAHARVEQPRDHPADRRYHRVAGARSGARRRWHGRPVSGSACDGRTLVFEARRSAVR